MDFKPDCDMIPEQSLMDIKPDRELQNSIDLLIKRENKDAQGTPDGLVLRCTNNCVETINALNTLLDEKSTAPKELEHVEVDIVSCTKINEIRSTEVEDPDATEYSSSFADTNSDTDKRSGPSEAEVESQSFGDSQLTSSYNAFGSNFRTRKKLTTHWRNFIHPLMWRCKWTELKIKEIESQASKYAKELAVCEQRKHSGMYKSTFDGFCSRSLPFSNECYRRKATKRRKRKKVEDTTDAASYIANHNLFSYLENKKPNLEVTSTVVDFSNTAIKDQHADCIDKSGIYDDHLLIEFGDGDDILEQVLQKIETVHSRVHKLKNQVGLVISTNASKFSSSENLSLLAACDAQTSSAPSPTFSAGNGETISEGAFHPATQHIPGYDIGDLAIPESVMSGFREGVHVPDIIESTVGLLSAADVTFNQPQIRDSSEDIVDNVLIHNQAADGEQGTVMGTNIQLTEKNHETERCEEGESGNPFLVPKLEPDLMEKNMGSQGQSALNSCLASDLQIPRNKRKRGERKAGSGGWNKKCSGEPDSQ